MNVLAFDTATPRPALAVAGDNFEATSPLPAGRQVSEVLLDRITELLQTGGIQLSDISRIAALSGPGSFTGIRVGLATAWGLCRALDVPLETVGSLEAAAESARGTGHREVCPSFDTERGEIFLGHYELSGRRAVQRTPPRIVPRDEARQACRPGSFLFSVEEEGEKLTLPALACARAVRTQPGPARTRPSANYVRVSAAEEFHGVR